MQINTHKMKSYLIKLLCFFDRYFYSDLKGRLIMPQKKPAVNQTAGSIKIYNQIIKGLWNYKYRQTPWSMRADDQGLLNIGSF